MALVEYLGIDNIRAMTFVDGENLAIRCKARMEAKSLRLGLEAKCRPDVYVWSSALSGRVVAAGAMLRTYYYNGKFTYLGRD